MSSSSSTQTQALIPGLPNDVAGSILASIPISHHPRLKPTSRSWHSFLSSPAALSLRRHLLSIFPSDPSLSFPYLFDPSTLAWSPLPPIPCSPHLYGLSNFVTVSSAHRLFLLGGSQFDAHSYPLGLPTSSPAAHCLDLSLPHSLLSWSRLPDMNFPRGSFACATLSKPGGRILVAGGGSRHTMFPCGGNRIAATEMFDEISGEWKEAEPLPRCRAGCVGWVMPTEDKEEEEFWVMGGYDGYRTVSGVFPADVYCRDSAVLGLRSGKWREIGDMWEDGERRKLGPVAVIHGEDGEAPGIFMLEKSDIFRYNFTSNRWLKEATLRRKIGDESCGFVAMNGELHVLTSTPSCIPLDTRRPSKKRATLDIQVYHPKKRIWKFLTTTTPFNQPLDFKNAVLCTIHMNSRIKIFWLRSSEDAIKV